MARLPAPNFVGQIPFFGSEPDPDDGGDFRAVPVSDRGNARYSDRGALGSYAPTSESRRDPQDVRHFSGYGCSEADYERGYIDPTLREDPAYDLANYKMRSTIPMSPDEDDNPATTGARDMEFRGRGERSRGFLPRPRIPTDR